MSDGQPSMMELLARVAVAEARAAVAEERAAVAQARVAEFAGANRPLAGQLETALAQLAALHRAAGRDSTNSSMPPSSDGLGARAAKDARKQAGRERRKAEQEAKSATAAGGKRRARGGQAGHAGAGLDWRVDPDEVIDVQPMQCCGCGGHLDPATASPGRVAGRVQVFDVPPVSIRCIEYRTITRICISCGTSTTAPTPESVPAGVTGGTCYGPQLRAIAAFAGAEEVISLQRSTRLVAALTGAVISTGFVSSCLQRVDDCQGGPGSRRR